MLIPLSRRQNALLEPRKIITDGRDDDDEDEHDDDNDDVDDDDEDEHDHAATQFSMTR